MSQLWTGFAGGVIGAAVTSGTSWLAVRSSNRAAERAARSTRRAAAYGEFLSRIGSIAYTADSVRTLLVHRTGMSEGLGTLFGYRKPMAPEDVISLLRHDLDPLYASWSQVWACGSPATITLANELMDAAIGLLSASSQGGRGTIATAVLGQAFTDEQAAGFANDTKHFAELRRNFAELIRAETGEDIAKLYPN